ncbi:MAG: UPF0182 family membrane protein [Gemmatimonadaceae bacterium]
MPKRSRRTAPLVIAAVALALILLPNVIRLSTDWYWFREIGYLAVFRAELLLKLGLFLGAGAATFALLFANLRLAQRGLVPDPVVVRLSPAAPHVDVTALLRRLALPVSLGIAFLVAVSVAPSWLELIAFANRNAFGVTDPIFQRDIGFYVFTLPVIATVLGVLVTLVVLSIFLLVPVYWLRGDIVLAPRHVRVEPMAQWHLGILLAAFFLLTAIQLWFVRIPGLLYSNSGPLVGASYTDLAATLPALRIQAVVALLAAVVVAVGAFRRTVVWFAALATGGYILVWLLAGVLWPAALQRLVVAPNELIKETPQLTHHIDFTRRAWGLDRVTTREITGEASLTRADLARNASTLDNVRLWDREPLLQTFGQLQEIRTYYDFLSVDDDRYWINGKYRQVLLSPRELNSASLPTRSFINQHLTFTHGMGITLAPVNEVTSEGLPVLFIKDLPPESSVGLPITQPQIYFGELTNDYVLVRTDQKEFDYPSGEDNVFTRYEGTGGVSVAGMWQRAMLAIRFGSLKLFLTNDVNADSRVIYRRNVRERAAAALPFLTLDGDPYMVVDSAGALQWIIDAYTTSGRYPYAQPLRNGVNYMRNSVKIVISAYDGSVDAYVSDATDPIVRAYAAAFPELLRPMSEMPGDLRAHLRYAEDLYRAQTDIYRVFHMDDAEEFYHREDEWQIPALDRTGDRPDPFMRRMIMRLPEEAQAEFLFMTPYTPRQKDNLAAWIVARSDGDHYGELIAYRFPKQSLVFGPQQVVNRINQDTEIARQLTLWDQRGSEVIRGELLVIPIEAALLYVQPIYLRAQGGRIPELKRVVVAYQNQVVMADGLDQALQAMFGEDGRPAGPIPTLVAGLDEGPGTTAGGATPQPTTAATPAPAASGLSRSALDHYDRAVRAQRDGDWATYGAELDRLGSVLRQLARPTAPSTTAPAALAPPPPPPR